MIVPKLRSPIVLVHGLFGFDQISVGSWTVAHYFPGIPQALVGGGNCVLIPRLSPTQGIASRAAQLKAFLDRKMPNEPVHILAHSLGGLDARYLISRLGMGKRILTLTTLGTPHKGCTFVDWGVRRLEWFLKPVFDMIGVPTQAFYDLTTAGCREFNEKVPDHPDVRYFSVAGRFQSTLATPEWLLSNHIVLSAEGPNDGVVSIASASYGEVQDVWDGDHLSLVNWHHPLARQLPEWIDPTPRYGPLVRRLADMGY
jgi:triacylglycerol lipase